MKTYQANLINVSALILMPLWAYLTFESNSEKDAQSVTAFIPLFLGIILLLCNNGIKNENKVIAHIAVLVTFIALIGLTMPLQAAISEDRTMSILRVGIMLFTGMLAMITFIRSFIANRKSKTS